MSMELIVILEFFINLYKLTNNMKGSGEKKKKKKAIVRKVSLPAAVKVRNMLNA